MRSDEIVTISGKRGHGKTTLAKHLIQRLDRVVIWDPMGEYEHPNAHIPSRGDVKEFDIFMDRYWHTGNIFILIDEADQVMSEGRPLCPYANRIINLGRHRNIGVGMVTRRLANLSKSAVAQSARLYLFQHFLPNDIKYLDQFLPDTDELKTLKKYQYKRYML